MYLKEAAPQFKVLKKNILDYYKKINKAKKVIEHEAKKAKHEAKKAAVAAKRAVRAHGCTRGTRARARARGRGARGRDMGVEDGASARMDNADSGLESSGTPESSESSSSSDSESKAEIPIPRSHQQHPVHVIQGCCEEATDQERSQHTEQPQPHPCPRSLPCMHQPLLET
jgi:hypothetical protein